MKRILVFLLVLFVMLDVQGQRKKVGLVLSVVRDRVRCAYDG